MNILSVCAVLSLLAMAHGKLDDAQCTQAFHKSAVTPEAAAEAERAKQAKVAYSGEIYSSKVKSKRALSLLPLSASGQWSSLPSAHSFQVLKPAPYFSGTCVNNKQLVELNLNEFSGKYLILLFYPLDFTFVCPTEIIAFSDRADEFRKLNTEIVAISTDSQFTHLAWVNTPRDQGGLGNVNIPLLSDITHQISKDYGVYLEHLGHSLRGLFIIDGKGIVRQISKHASPLNSRLLLDLDLYPRAFSASAMNDLPVGRSVDETLRLIQAFQWSDTHDEVCPANWKPGDRTIIPDPSEKLKYFSKVKKHDEQ